MGISTDSAEWENGERLRNALQEQIWMFLSKSEGEEAFSEEEIVRHIVENHHEKLWFSSSEVFENHPELEITLTRMCVNAALEMLYALGQIHVRVVEVDGRRRRYWLNHPKRDHVPWESVIERVDELEEEVQGS